MSTPRDPSPRVTPGVKRRAPHRAFRSSSGRLVGVVGKSVLAILGLAALGVLIGVVGCASSATTNGVGAGSDATVTTNAPASGDEWIPLQSPAAADILAAARRG